MASLTLLITRKVTSLTFLRKLGYLSEDLIVGRYRYFDFIDGSRVEMKIFL